MKLERINENQIRCTLTGQDLADRHLKLSELAYGSAKAKHLFQDMMQLASCELGFEADDIPLMIEAIPLASGSIILNVTKVEYPEELDTRFSNFSDYGDYPDYFDEDEEEEEYAARADSILDLFRKLNDALVPPDAEVQDPEDGSFIPLKDTAPAARLAALAAAADLERLFSFREMDPIIRLAHVLNGFYNGDNSLYLDTQNNVYYLLVHKNEHTPADFNRVCNIAAEYAYVNQFEALAKPYFEEHFVCVRAHTALQSLAQFHLGKRS